MSSVSDEKFVDEIAKTAGESSLITILQEVQSRYNYLPEQVLALLSKKLEVPLLFSNWAWFTTVEITKRFQQKEFGQKLFWLWRLSLHQTWTRVL